MNFRHICIFYSLGYIAVFTYILAFPIVDFNPVQVVFDGTSTNFTYTLTYWMMVVLILGNVWLGLMLLAAVAEYTSSVRRDIHYILAILVTAANLLIFAGMCLIYLFLINTSYSGNQLFNDPKWCCLFNLDSPEFCANTVGCSASLSPNYQYHTILIFSGVFVLLAFIHVIFNRKLTGGDNDYRGGLLFGIVFHFIYLAIFAAWVAWPLLNTFVANGYLQFGIPPNPGPNYTGARYYWQWWTLWWPVSNLAPPVSFFASLVADNNPLISYGQFWICVIVGIITFICFLILLGIWAGYTNYWWSGNSIGNSYAYCCEFYASQPDFCNNVNNCSPNTTFQWLPNDVFIQNVVFIGVMWLLAYCAAWVNVRMKRYGVFS